MTTEQQLADLELENVAARSLINDLLDLIDVDDAEDLITEIVNNAN